MHTPPSRPLGCVAALLAIHLAAPAQQPDHGQPPTDLARALTPTSPLVTELDGGLWGFGQRYKAEFRAQDVEFTPALGHLAPHNMTVGLALRSVGRGATETPVSPAARSYAGNQVVYRRAEVAERYDVRLDGLEQSFVFDQLPAGEGDLVVRATMTTEFVVAPHGDGLALQLPGKVGSTSAGSPPSTRAATGAQAPSPT